jgi:PAS domain S-box-containing protein
MVKPPGPCGRNARCGRILLGAHFAALVPAPVPVDEPSRLAALREHEILDTPDEPAFDEIARLAAQICQTPIALVTLIDEKRQWFKARVGLGIRETPRDMAFCAHAILHEEVFVVQDAAADERFRANPLVTGDPKIRFYAGMPLATAEGHRLGTVCAIDRVPRQLTALQKEALAALAHQASRELELRRRIAELSRLSKELAAAEEAATRSQTMLRQVINSAPLALFALDAQGRFTVAEGKGVDALGISPRHVLGKRLHDVHADRPDLLAAVDGALAGRATGAEAEFNGQVFEVSLSPIRAAQGQVNGVVGVANDVTTRRKAEALAQVAVERAQAIAKLRSIIGFKADALNMVAHELNTPLTPIRVQLHLLEEDKGLSARQQQAVSIVARNVARLQSLVENMLEYARFESNQVELKPARMDLAEAIRQAAQDYAEAARQQDVLLRLHVEGPLQVHADSRRIMQVLSNLLSNALKYTPAGGRVDVHARIQDGRAYVSVEDTGVGFDANKAGMLFHPFARLPNRLSGKATGHGLGLHICRQIVTMHGGAIWAESPGADKGSAFRLTIPLDKGPAAGGPRHGRGTDP